MGERFVFHNNLSTDYEIALFYCLNVHVSVYVRTQRDAPAPTFSGWLMLNGQITNNIYLLQIMINFQG